MSPYKKVRQPSEGDQLTPRETQALVFMASGLQIKQISELMRISYWTVNDHLKSGYLKLGIANRAEAAVWCCERGLVGTHPTQAIPLPDEYIERLLRESGHEAGEPMDAGVLRVFSARLVAEAQGASR